MYMSESDESNSTVMIQHKTMASWYQTRRTVGQGTASVTTLFLAGLNGISVLTCYDFDLLSRDHFVGFHFEGSVLDYECPNIVTETVSMQVTLGKFAESEQEERKRYQEALRLSDMDLPSSSSSS